MWNTVPKPYTLRVAEHSPQRSVAIDTQDDPIRVQPNRFWVIGPGNRGPKTGRPRRRRTRQAYNRRKTRLKSGNSSRSATGHARRRSERHLAPTNLGGNRGALSPRVRAARDGDADEGTGSEVRLRRRRRSLPIDFERFRVPGTDDRRKRLSSRVRARTIESFIRRTTSRRPYTVTKTGCDDGRAVAAARVITQRILMRTTPQKSSASCVVFDYENLLIKNTYSLR